MTKDSRSYLQNTSQYLVKTTCVQNKYVHALNWTRAKRKLHWIKAIDHPTVSFPPTYRRRLKVPIY